MLKLLTRPRLYMNIWAILSHVVSNYIIPVTFLFSSTVRALVKLAINNVRQHVNEWQNRDLSDYIDLAPRSAPNTADAAPLQDEDGVDENSAGPTPSTPYLLTTLRNAVASLSNTHTELRAPLRLSGLTTRVTSHTLRTDIYDSIAEETTTAELDVPGFGKDDIDISLAGGMLTISCTRASPSPDRVYLVREKEYGQFVQTLKVPAMTKGADLKASVRDGVLSITFPRVTERTTEKIRVE